MTRRHVRVSDAFFVQLDQQFGSERADDGAPSATDFLIVELPTILERFALEFDQLPQVIDGVLTARVLVAVGVLVPVVAVYAVLTSEDVVELIGLEIDDFLKQRHRAGGSATSNAGRWIGIRMKANLPSLESRGAARFTAFVQRTARYWSLQLVPSGRDSSALGCSFAPSDTSRTVLWTLSRWRHGFESRWGCKASQQASNGF